MYVSAESAGSIARFISHACRPNTLFYEVLGRHRVVVSLVAQRVIRINKEVTVDYQGKSGELQFHCQCSAHIKENSEAIRLTRIKQKARDEVDGS